MRLINLIIGVGVIAVLALGMSVFVVDETEYAIKLRLGQVEKSDYKPGIHFKIPFIHEIKRFDNRLQTVNLKSEKVLNNELKNMLVDSFVKWRVKDPLRFYLASRGDVERGNKLLEPIIKNDIKFEMANATVQEAISSKRLSMMNAVQKSLNSKAESIGIEVVDVRINRIDFVEAVRKDVFQRMIKGREKVAREFRSTGQEQAKIIRARADRTRQELVAEAYRESETVRGEGDAEAAKIYAKAYNKDPEFYRFYRSLLAYQTSFDGKENMLVIDPNSEFFKYFKHSKGKAK